LLDGVLQDLQFATRLLAKDRRFTIATVLALGLGIGVNNSVFALINTALLRDLPFEEPDRLVRVRTVTQAGEAGVSYADFVDWPKTLTSLSGLAGSIEGAINISEEERPPERVRGTYISSNTFTLLGRSPLLGRGFEPEDERPGAPPAVILGYNLWRTRYGSDPTVVGRTVRLNDVPATIVGVMPAGFKFPLITQLWQPLTHAPGLTTAGRGQRMLSVVGRLADGADLPQARAELAAVSEHLAIAYPETNADTKASIKLLRDGTGGANIASILLTLMAGCASCCSSHALTSRASCSHARQHDRARSRSAPHSAPHGGESSANC
jgi:hypothetical protein